MISIGISTGTANVWETFVQPSATAPFPNSTDVLSIQHSGSQQLFVFLWITRFQASDIHSVVRKKCLHNIISMNHSLRGGACLFVCFLRKMVEFERGTKLICYHSKPEK